MKTYAIFTKAAPASNPVPYINGFETQEQASAIADDLNSQRVEGDVTEYVVIPVDGQVSQPAILPAVIPPLFQTKSGKLAHSARAAMEWTLSAFRDKAPNDGMRRTHAQGHGKYTKYVMKGDIAAMILRANGFDPKLRNDAPKGGAQGDYYECQGWRPFIEAVLATY